MKTTEIFVEQVIIGGLVMLIGYILFWQDIQGYLCPLADAPFTKISIGALLVGAAYLIGIVYDRFTDTMFQDLERHCRLSYALKGIRCEKELEKDPYPENDYRMEILQSEPAVNREEYLRRRLRLIRALATLIPGISVAIILYMATKEPEWDKFEFLYNYEAAIIPVAYLLAFLSKNTKHEFVRGEIPPKTNEKWLLRKYWEKHDSDNKRGFLRFICSDSACIILFFTFTSISAVQATLLGGFKFAMVMLVGTVVAMVTAWCWWRIYHTYFAFIRNFYKSTKGKQIAITLPFSLSAEVRWFFCGEIPNNVEKWFKSSKLRDKSKKRTDTYLIYPNAKSCGVKFRKSKFEIKSLVKDIGNRDFGAKARGAIRIWEKWSTKGESIGQFKQEVTVDEAAWVDVKKKRIIRKFSADNGQIREIDASGKEGFPDNGCNVELTKVEIHQRPYWSLAFGSFGEEDTLVDNLTETVRILSEKECPFKNLSESLEVSLSEEKCHSYPSFLALHRNDHKG